MSVLVAFFEIRGSIYGYLRERESRHYPNLNRWEENLQVLGSRSDTSDPSGAPLTELEFSELSLSEALQQGILEAGFRSCTPIQSKALPLALSGRDVAGQAQTGTGKTAAYLIALFNKLDTEPPLTAGPPGPRALVLAPTRELAVQIHKDATVLGKYLPYTLGLAFGGTDYDKQRKQLADGVDVLIGTPGRAIDYHKQRVFSLTRTQVIVLDEADRMFDLGFIRDIRYVLRRLPERHHRLNLLFSATLTYRVLELAYEHMNDPELVRIEPDKMTVDRVRQSIYFPANEEKAALLIMLLRDMDARRTMVFVNTKREAERLCDRLERNGINAAAISGDVPQRKRLKMMKDFQTGLLPVLIGTDVASRGLHVPDVSHVFNYDLPQDAEDYVHRIGRTARAGAFGDAISFGCEDYVTSLPDIEEYIGHKIPVSSIDRDRLDAFGKTLAPAPARREDRRRGGGSRERGGPRVRGEGGSRGGRNRDDGLRGGASRAGEARGGETAPVADPEASEPGVAERASGDGGDARRGKSRRRRSRRAKPTS
jgi:ATP-dependent RNA helicase RhlB